MSLPFTDNITALNAVTATTTSLGYDVSKRQQITVQFIASAITSGTGAFTIDGSNDGANWVTGIAFRDSKSTSSTTWVVTKTLSANGTEAAFVPAGFKLIRVVVTRTTDGTYSAIIQNAG
jgi:hypothetical protein